MYKILAIKPENGFFAGGRPSEPAISMAVGIIPNLFDMFKKIRTFFQEKLATKNIATPMR
jgi:hypothetical protein